MILFQEVKKLVRKNCRVNEKALPVLFFFTDRKQFPDIFEVIKSMPNAGAAIIVREYDLSHSDRTEFAKKIIKIAKEKSLLVLIGKNLKMALELKADGVHFSDHDNCWKKYSTLKLKKNFIFTCSTHSSKSLNKSYKSDFYAVLYSPIFTTKTHLNQKSVGVLNLAKIALKSKIPLYALGGVNLSNLRQLKNCYISGIAGISIFSLKENEKN